MLTEPLATTECMNVVQRPRLHSAHAQDDLNMHILFMFEGSFSFDAALMNNASNGFFGDAICCSVKKVGADSSHQLCFH